MFDTCFIYLVTQLNCIVGIPNIGSYAAEDAVHLYVLAFTTTTPFLVAGRLLFGLVMDHRSWHVEWNK